MNTFYEDDHLVVPFCQVLLVEKGPPGAQVGLIVLATNNYRSLSLAGARWEKFITDYCTWLKETGTLCRVGFFPEGGTPDEVSRRLLHAEVVKALTERDDVRQVAANQQTTLHDAFSTVEQLTKERDELKFRMEGLEK